MTGILICGGTIIDYNGCRNILPDNDDADDVVVICADSGTRHTKQLQLVPNLIMGDMDSIDPKLLDEMKDTVKIEYFSAEKDYTDSELIANKAVEMGCTKLIFLAAWGSRMDHSLANIMLMERLALNGCECIMADGVNFIYSVNKKITLERKNAPSMVSLLPSTAYVKGITTKGLKYGLAGSVMRRGENIGVSNYIVNDIAEINIDEGLLLVILSPKE